jgi:hypothetical protein
MARQEEGGVHTPVKGSKLAITTDVARGGSNKNPVQKGMRVRDVRIKRARVHGESSARFKKYKGKKAPKNKKITTHTRKSLLVSRAYIAFKYHLYLPMGGSGGERNLFRVTNFRMTGKGSHRVVEFEKVEVYNFEHRKTFTHARPWLMPACEEVGKQAQKIFNSQMNKVSDGKRTKK